MPPRLPSDKEHLVLRLLQDGPGEMYGLEIVKASAGELGRAAIYVTLARMEEKGYLKSRIPAGDSHPGLPRPRYQLTALGQQALRAADAARIILGLHGARTPT